MKAGGKGSLSYMQILSEHKMRNASKAMSLLHLCQILLESHEHSPRALQTAEEAGIALDICHPGHARSPGWQLHGQAQHEI